MGIETSKTNDAAGPVEAEYDDIATEDELGEAPEAPEGVVIGDDGEVETEETSETSNATRVSVTVDTPWEEILNYDKAGKLLVFGAGKASPPELSEQQLAELSAVNRERYSIVQEALSATNDDKVMDEIQNLVEMGKTAIYARALDRLKVWNKDPRFEYVWSAPHNLHWRLNRGYAVVRNGQEHTMFQQKDGTHRIADKGDEELILMKAPLEIKRMEEEKRQKDYEKSLRRSRQQIENTPIWEEDEAAEKQRGYRYKPIRG
jgi:hypothetical protein